MTGGLAVESGLKLASCPFCGREAAFSGSESAGYRVQCCGCGIEGGWGDYGYQAASAWNTRAPSDAALVEALDACKVKFAEYALLHYRKRTPDGDEKAMANQRMADMCDAALAAAKGQP